MTTNERHEIDISISPEQIYFPINIESAKNKGERSVSVNLVAKDLDTLIRNKFTIVTDTGAYLNYLDHEYGLCKHTCIDEFISFIISLIVIAFMANNMKYNSLVHLQFWMWYRYCKIYDDYSFYEGAVENIFTTRFHLRNVQNLKKNY
ncbi:hypothetical protein RclHR1_11110002 [Rhizophagus clarus]|uniref:Uncharacterized protein n=1 Tax=Rhizophagus clarus TaxID=94130 RepID=A0A2Z6Q3E1_9GLOM|nr:hypothetical protein RclHR1_11110002 [Rhizophagus clarus]